MKTTIEVYQCVYCHQPIMGVMVGAGDGSGSDFAHPDCFDNAPYPSPTNRLAILKTSLGLIQLERCPVCKFFVQWTDMYYENEKAVSCHFCIKDKSLLHEIEEKDIRGTVLVT